MQERDEIINAMRRDLVDPVVFVLSVDKNGKPNGLIAGWNMKTSYNPPTIAVALYENNNTQKLIRESKEFVIAYPSPEMREQVEYFGTSSGASEDKFMQSGIKILPGTVGKTPILADARINLECELASIVKSNDHYIFFGNVKFAHLNPEKEQLFYIGRDGNGDRVFDSVKPLD